MVIFKIDPRCLPFFSDVLRKIMSAGTRWFCVMKRKTVTVNSLAVCGVSAPRPRGPLAGRGATETHSLIHVSAFVTDRFEDLFCFESEKSCTLLLLD